MPLYHSSRAQCVVIIEVADSSARVAVIVVVRPDMIGNQYFVSVCVCGVCVCVVCVCGVCVCVSVCYRM